MAGYDVYDDPRVCMNRLPALLVLAAALAVGGCSPLAPRPELPEESSLSPGDSTPLDRVLADTEAAHAGQSGFRLITEGPEAFAARAWSAHMAGRSLDVQTYIWHADLTGLYLARQLLAAADRGVKVRLLLDDLDAHAKNIGFAALDAHPHIEVRLFNPFSSRAGVLAKLGEFVGSFDRLNHRMHNKSWIADNRIAIAGGRNLGDEYFGASDGVNFVDLDFAMVGPVVRDVSRSFDRYWNSVAVYPIHALDPDAVDSVALDRLRAALITEAELAEESAYAEELRAITAQAEPFSGSRALHWTEAYQFVSDDPLKAIRDDDALERSRVLNAILPTIQTADDSLILISPYFVPGERGTELLVAKSRSGRAVRILTNSLVATDVAAVHGGYSRYRPALIEGGVELYELKPEPGSDSGSSFVGSSGASLHTKALAVDGERLFVGSYNLDPRSTSLNCEQGVLVDDAVLARQLEAIFARKSTGERAWRVTVDDGGLLWSDGNQSFRSDPRASLGRRLQAWLARLLHLDEQL